MSSSSCSSSSLAMLYCCSSTSAKDSMARMDSLSFRVRTMSWNGERPTDQTLLEKHVQPCLLVADGQMGLTSQFPTCWEYKLKWKAAHKPATTNCEHEKTRKDACVGGLKISQEEYSSVWIYETASHSNASQVLKMLQSSLWMQLHNNVFSVLFQHEGQLLYPRHKTSQAVKTRLVMMCRIENAPTHLECLIHSSN